MDDTTLKAIFGALLIVNGFKRKTAYWYRQNDEIVQAVNLQGSQWGKQWYVNLCWVPIGMDVKGMPTPKTQYCPIQTRVEGAFQELGRLDRNMFNLENDLSDEVRAAEITKVVRDYILPFMNGVKDASSLRREILQGRLKSGAVMLTAREHLRLPMP
jgi:hypothetical protein